MRRTRALLLGWRICCLCADKPAPTAGAALQVSVAWLPACKARRTRAARSGVQPLSQTARAPLRGGPRRTALRRRGGRAGTARQTSGSCTPQRTVRGSACACRTAPARGPSGSSAPPRLRARAAPRQRAASRPARGARAAAARRTRPRAAGRAGQQPTGKGRRTGTRLRGVGGLQPAVWVVHGLAVVVLHQRVIAPDGRVLRRLHRQAALQRACRAPGPTFVQRSCAVLSQAAGRPVAARG